MDSPFENMPRPELEALQAQRLLATVERTYHKSPLFHELMSRAGVKPADIRNREDFIRLVPTFNKDDIRAYRDRHKDPCGGLVRLNDHQLTTMLTTSGTTGDPTPMPIRRRTSDNDAYVRAFWHIGARPGDFLIMPVFTFRGGAANGIAAQNEAGLTSIYFNHDPRELPRMIEALKQFRPTVFGLMSGPLLLGLEKLLENSNEDPRELFSSVKGAIWGGEAMSPRLKRLTDSWGLQLYETMACGDTVSATTCSAHDGFHAWEDMAYVECIDPDSGEPVADGEVGEMVVTNINDPFLTMVRFRTDDLVVLDRSPCSCGRTHLRYKMRGRVGDRIIVQGKSILPVDIRFHIEERPETSGGMFQIIRTAREMDVCSLRVGYRADRLSGTTDDLIRVLEADISAILDVPVRVELTPEEELLKLGPPHKIPRVTKK